MGAAACVGADGRGHLRAPRLLQSWPGIVHGGGVVALLDAAAAALGGSARPRTLQGRLASPLPLETDLDLDGLAGPDGTTFTVRLGGQTLTSGTVRPLARADAAARWPGAAVGPALPTSDDCLACGARNPIGLRAELSFDEVGVWTRLLPTDAWRRGDGRVHPAVAPVLLDEIAWWLGALASGDGGVTNRIALALLAPEAAVDGPVIAAGRLADVAPVDKKRVFWRTETALMSAAGDLLATASIVFRGGAGYSERQMDYFRRRT